jgi:hypothetical protein
VRVAAAKASAYLFFAFVLASVAVSILLCIRMTMQLLP